MKVFTLWLCSAMFLIPLLLCAQEKKTFSGDYTNTPLKQVIENITEEGGVVFYYAHETLDTVKLTAHFKNEPLSSAIDIILDNVPISFYVRNNQVSLFLDPKKNLASRRFMLTGTVRDYTGKIIHTPVFVNVSMYTDERTGPQNKRVTLEFRKQVTTDDSGVYFIDKLKPGEYRVRFDADDYYKTTEQLNLTTDAIKDVQLISKKSSTQAQSSSKNENISILQKVVSIDGGELPATKMLKQISTSGNFIFAYDSAIISQDQKVVLKTGHGTVKDILDDAFANTPITYTEFKDKVILRKKNPNPQKHTISGTIKDANTGENLIGVSIGIKGAGYGSTSNQYGYYSLTIPEGDYVLTCSYIGYQPTVNEINLFNNVKLDIKLSDDPYQLQEVVITDEHAAREISEVAMGTTTLSSKTIKAMPAFLGETDVIKSITLLPGVATVGEGTTGFNVRGGGVDQNLVILDEAPVYNTSHLFGFFSVFNPDVVKDITLYKSGVPAKYGGRLSSVLDVTQKDGNNQKLAASGGIGFVGARLALEGPLVKDRSSFIIAARKSYIGELLKGVDDLKNSTVGFYDLNAKVNFKINDRNKIFWSAYSGKDNLTLGDDDIYLSYRNLTTTFRWNHLISDKLFSNVSAVYSNYKYVQGSTEKDFEFEGTNGIVTYNLKSDFTYYLNSKHTINYGLSFLLYQFKGLKIHPASGLSPVAPFNVSDEHALEPAIYVQDDYSINEKIKFSVGVRYSSFYSIGPGSVYAYQDNLPRSVSTITDTISYKNGALIKQYGGFEPRLGVKVLLDKNSFLQVTYDRSRQNIHLISNTTSATPLDVWKGSDKYVKPEIANQYSIGYFRNVRDNTVEASVQVYYKDIQNIVDYKDGADLVLNKAIDADLLTGIGKAYGIEFSLNKTIGRFNGWLSYTYSRTLRQVNGKFPSEKINNGKYYPATYDMPNRITFSASYKVSPRFSISSNFTYNTGRPTTYPDGRYYYGAIVVPQYTSRNQDRISDYHRLDLAFTLDGKPHKKWRSQWVFSIYNVYSRRNAYSIYLHSIKHTPETESIRLSILGSALPSITYNFKI